MATRATDKQGQTRGKRQGRSATVGAWSSLRAGASQPNLGLTGAVDWQSAQIEARAKDVFELTVANSLCESK